MDEVDRDSRSSKTLARVAVWAANATDPDPTALHHTRVWTTLLDDWQQKTLQIQACECDLASLLVKTPCVLLLSHLAASAALFELPLGWHSGAAAPMKPTDVGRNPTSSAPAEAGR
ncbi:MAG: hypothetical protein R3C59_16190 [Planctomycetaceae bacterium]